MRIEAVKLTWFRGAAIEAKLEPRCKSMIVYGANGSGKSSFVDAIEYALKDGKIKHLAHEYSSKRLENCVINTHVPDGKQTSFSIRFKDSSEVSTVINRNGSHTTTCTKGTPLEGWDYQRTVLRQDEVAGFIRDTKGGKYSALLPLLGLSEMEVAAENIRQLLNKVSQESKLNETQNRIKEAEVIRGTDLGGIDDKAVLAQVEELRMEYSKNTPKEMEATELCGKLKAALKAKIGGLNTEAAKHFVLRDVAKLNLRTNIDSIRAANEKLAKFVEPLIAEKLAVLEATDTFVAEIGEEDKVECPACGRSIKAEDLKQHVCTEKDRLQEVDAIFAGRRTAINALCGTVASLRSSLGRAEVQPWYTEFNKGPLTTCFAFLQGLDIEALRSSFSEDDLQAFTDKLQPLIDTAAESSKHAPPDAKKLSDDSQTINAAKEIIRSWELSKQLKRSKILISYLESLEKGIRGEIRRQSQKVIGDISTDIQRMWSVLHPGEPIEGVSLYIPKDTDKAIDIGLKFHGVAQNSPRLTLSEGYRNSLGLCIFLSMAKREQDTDRPLFLDDVVVSLDRNHRGFIVQLLEEEFSNRQVIVFTHDRDWFIELRQQLGGADWVFKSLMPYQDPAIGICWSEKTWTFEDARSQLEDGPDVAGNTARKIMDITLALLAQSLKLKLPYLHREKNDHRLAHDFLLRFIADGQQCFKKQGSTSHDPHGAALVTLRIADKLLLVSGNKSSHSFDIVRKEAEKLIQACESALDVFICDTCKKPVHYSNNEKAKFTQCQCGELRWCYGKG